MISFSEFIDAYRNDTLQNDVSWRAYDIQSVVEKHKNKYALKGKKLAGFAIYENFDAVASFYGLAHIEQAKQLLALWAVWRIVNSGKLSRIATIRHINAPSENC